MKRASDVLTVYPAGHAYKVKARATRRERLMRNLRELGWGLFFGLVAVGVLAVLAVGGHGLGVRP